MSASYINLTILELFLSLRTTAGKREMLMSSFLSGKIWNSFSNFLLNTIEFGIIYIIKLLFLLHRIHHYFQLNYLYIILYYFIVLTKKER